jgi:hypothetical protein
MPVVRRRMSIDFRLSIDCSEPYELWWKVRNTGEEATAADCLRGKIVKDDGQRRRTEVPHTAACTTSRSMSSKTESSSRRTTTTSTSRKGLRAADLQLTGDSRPSIGKTSLAVRASSS